MSPYVVPPDIPEGMSCSEYRRSRSRPAAIQRRNPWKSIVCRVAAVLLHRDKEV